MSKPAAKPYRVSPVLAAGVCAVVAIVLFHFFGNAVRGWVNTPSLFWWTTSQWLDPNADAEHGWLILGLSAWLFWRNLRVTAGSERREARGEGREARAEGQEERGEGRQERNERTGALASGPWPLTSSIASMLAALALHAVGFVAQQTRLSILAFLLFTWGVLRLGGGRRWGEAAMFPLAFLVFAIPVNVLDSLGFWLRVWVVDASAAIARAAGIAVLQSGTQLVAPDGSYNYDVAAACSGVRSLTAMAALSLLAGYLNFRGWGRRALILLLCLPLVYAGNVARIVAIVFAAEAGGTRWGDRAHEIMGYGVFVIVLGGVLVAVAILRRWRPEEAEMRREGEGERREAGGERTEDRGSRSEDRGRRIEGGEAEPQTRGPRDQATKGRGGRWSVIGRRRLNDGGHLAAGRGRGVAAWWVASVISILSIAEMRFLRHVADSPARGEVGITLATGGADPVALPAFLGTEWIGRHTEVTAIEREILPPDTGFSRKLYVDLANPASQVLLSIVLSGRDRTSIHRPELCLVGQGWTVTGTSQHTFRHPAPGAGSFPATVLRVQREVQTPAGRVAVPQIVVYWFVGGEAVVATNLERVLRDSWQRVRHARADRWAYVLMQTGAGDGEAAALARMQAVLDGTLPVFLPSVRAGQNPEV